MYFATIREANTTQVVMPKPSQQRPISQQPQPQIPNKPQQPTTQIVQPQPAQVQQTPQMQQPVKQQSTNGSKLVPASNKKQLNGTTPLNVRK
jgi:hypothetical protein